MDEGDNSPEPARRRTSTSNFGVGRRESHDASAFYNRFRPPEVSSDDRVAAPLTVDEPFVCADARAMTTLVDRSVALVVTSPPYFAGKAYEEELERCGIPSSYLEYLQMLRDVFAECVRVLEPGGRLAVNVANLGRRPFRSLSADVIAILSDDLGLLMRGELVWHKARGAGGSCAWGSFRSAANPVLRDVTERVVIASKGRFDRARSSTRRAAEGLPHRSDPSADDFTSMTLDVWDIPPESARRVGHPAPFPVELPERLISLYTFEGDLVLDPFMGSGSAMVAAARLGRRYVGYDTDPMYVDLARRRVEEELATASVESVGDRHAKEAYASGESVTALARAALAEAGFAEIRRNVRARGTGVVVDLRALDRAGGAWHFCIAGPFTRHRPGMTRPEITWRWLGQASALRGAGVERVVVLTTHLPRTRSEGDQAMRAAGPGAYFDAICLLSDADIERLCAYAAGDATAPLSGFW